MSRQKFDKSWIIKEAPKHKHTQEEIDRICDNAWNENKKWLTRVFRRLGNE